MIEAPPDYVIEAARLAAIQSPCAKSKRGVALFNREDADRWDRARSLPSDRQSIVSRGFNGPPARFVCKESMVCRGSCADICMHAEQRAIIAALGADDVCDLELVHVKVVDGKVVAGGGPSCLQCSKLVVDVGLRGVWLFEDDLIVRAARDGIDIGSATSPNVAWRFYRADVFHEATLANHGISSLGACG